MPMEVAEKWNRRGRNQTTSLDFVIKSEPQAKVLFLNCHLNLKEGIGEVIENFDLTKETWKP